MAGQKKILISEIFVKLYFQGFIQRAVKSFLTEIDRFQRFSAKFRQIVEDFSPKMHLKSFLTEINRFQRFSAKFRQVLEDFSSKMQLKSFLTKIDRFHRFFVSH